MIITTDLHLTDQVGDEYRWDLFKFIRYKANRYKQKELFILGDVTDYKDNHSARLVNRIVAELLSTLKNSWVEQIHILKGNHDYIDSDLPFLYFLSLIPGITFHTTPVDLFCGEYKLLLLPHSRDPEHEWSEVLGRSNENLFNRCDFVMMHQTVNGSLASNGMKMPGLSRSFFKSAKKVYSGDIHVPQVIGNIEYVGAPYTIRFNDVYKPRVLMVNDDGSQTNLRLITASKATVVVNSISDLENASFKKGDQIKLKVHLDREQTAHWKEYREELLELAKKKGAATVKVFVIVKESTRKRLHKDDTQVVDHDTDTSVLEAYARMEDIDKSLLQYGTSLVGRQDSHEKIDTASD